MSPGLLKKIKHFNCYYTSMSSTNEPEQTDG